MNIYIYIYLLFICKFYILLIYNKYIYIMNINISNYITIRYSDNQNTSVNVYLNNI